MPVLKLNANADIEGLIVPALPYIRRVEYSGGLAFDFDVLDSTSQALPLGPLTVIQTVIVRSSETVGVSLDGGSDITLNAGGIMVLADVTLASVTITNSSGNTAHIDGCVLGLRS